LLREELKLPEEVPTGFSYNFSVFFNITGVCCPIYYYYRVIIRLPGKDNYKTGSGNPFSSQ
jgi:hypothetical protein